MKRDYPERPIIGIGAVIVDGDRFVLVQRARAPHQGEWSIPGGMLECGESLKQGVIREAREETSLEVEPLALVEVFERIVRDPAGGIQFHYVIMDYLCRLKGGALRAGEDAADARWLRQGELEQLEIADGTIGVLQKALHTAPKFHP
ncbi:MAG TPA: NUDIX hydrolase [Terriglobales bacterium]